MTGREPRAGEGRAVTPLPSTIRSPAWMPWLRTGLALGLLALILAIIPIRDRLHWASRFPAGPLVGQLEREPGRVTFRADTGDVVTLLAAAGSEGFDRVLLWRPGQPQAQARPLAEWERSELASQPEEGLLTTLRRAATAPRAFLLAVTLYLIAVLLSFQRWHVLLRAMGIHTPLRRAVRLGFTGLLFNNLVPGMTGGDLVKAAYVAGDHPRRRAEAAVSVFIDRAFGIFGLALLGAAGLLFGPVRLTSITLAVVGLVFGLALGFLLLSSPWIHRKLRSADRLAGLPGADLAKRVVRVFPLLRKAPLAVCYALVISVVLQAVILTAIGMLGVSLGLADVAPFGLYYALAPLPLILQSLPITPAGLGVGEAAFVFVLANQARLAPAQGAVALSLTYRLVQLLISLIGGLCLLWPGRPERSGVTPAPGRPAGVPPDRGARAPVARGARCSRS